MLDAKAVLEQEKKKTLEPTPSQLVIPPVPKRGTLGRTVRLKSGRIAAEDEVTDKNPTRAKEALLGKYRISTVRNAGGGTDYVQMVMKELTRKLEQKAPPVKRAPRWLGCFVAPMETLVVDTKVPLEIRICAWFKLIKLWASMRFDDAAHLKTSEIRFYDGQLTGMMHQSKTTRAGKRVRELPIYIAKEAYVLQEDWLSIGFDLVKLQMPRDRTFVFPEGCFYGTVYGTSHVTYAEAVVDWAHHGLQDVLHGPFREEDGMGRILGELTSGEKGGLISGICSWTWKARVRCLGLALRATFPWPALRMGLSHPGEQGHNDDTLVSPLHTGVDCTATDDAAWIGGWLQESDNSKECRWFSLRVTERLAPWLLYRGKNPKRVIAALELLATLIALRLWLTRAGDSAEVHAEAFTDKGNAFILRKGLSTKYPVTLLVIEVAETLRRLDTFATLTWVRRDGNVLADALTNEDFGAFDPRYREAIDDKNLQWYVLDDLLQGSEELFNEIKVHKQKKRETNKTLGRAKKKAAKFFSRWKS
ncbi:unnamed protein product [Durusdinium trenchii]|uniref:RNase H type-1 domain-containing protein n=1 Tax=Durusdinium trenchii TaxID=1381693 RepID=A0ABP0RER0_9DINO